MWSKVPSTVIDQQGKVVFHARVGPTEAGLSSILRGFHAIVGSRGGPWAGCAARASQPSCRWPSRVAERLLV